MLERIAAAGLIVMAGVGCAGDGSDTTTDKAPVSKSEWTVVARDDLSAGQSEQLERAEQARNLLAGTLMAALTEELEVGGPAGAVDICRDMAPMLSAHAQEESGVRIGRTSHRLRNPDNRPPDWAAEIVDGRVTDLTTLVGPDGELGVMMPIRVAAPCLACHGPREALDEAVRASISEAYPNDQAVGFAEGDLRGWFWVEVPPISL